jgi:SAM-dependent methyltransferase
MTDDWDDIARWWVGLVRDDPTQSTDALDLLTALIDGTGGRTLDLGCGEGQVMRALDGPVVGTDLSERLLVQAAAAGPVVRARLPDLSWVRRGSIDRAIAVGVVDMLEDHVGFFLHTALAVRPGGHLIVVMNHPVATAPHSEPLEDPDGLILWRWGDYLVPGSSAQPAANRRVDLFHRPLGELLTTAAEAGWQFERMIERGPSDAAIASDPGFRGQGHIPHMLGARWVRR